MARGLTRLANELTGGATPGARPRCWVEPGVVKAVAGDYDTAATVTVTWRGTDVAVSYLDSYTPAQGDVVLILVQIPSLIVLGKLNGPNLETDDE
jgi:hypothetical protein